MTSLVRYCYLPLYIFAGELLLCARLRPANGDASAGATDEVARIVAQLGAVWPLARIIVRADSGFCRDALLTWCETHAVDDSAAGMLTWSHAGFHVHTAVWVPEDDRVFAARLARYGARNPAAMERLLYDRPTEAVTDRSDTSNGATAGTETVNPLEVLARVVVHISDKGHVTTRYDGWYANRPRRIPVRTGAGRGHPPLGEPAPAARRGRSSRAPGGPRGVGDRAVRSPDIRPTRTEFPILHIASAVLTGRRKVINAR